MENNVVCKSVVHKRRKIIPVNVTAGVNTPEKTPEGVLMGVPIADEAFDINNSGVECMDIVHEQPYADAGRTIAFGPNDLMGVLDVATRDAAISEALGMIREARNGVVYPLVLSQSVHIAVIRAIVGHCLIPHQAKDTGLYNAHAATLDVIVSKAISMIRESFNGFYIKDLSVERMFLLEYKKGDSALNLIQYDNLEGTGVPRILSVTLQRWQQLVLNHKPLTMTLNALRRGDNLEEIIHLGGGFYAEVKPPSWCVNVYQFYMKDQSLTRTSVGMDIKCAEWENIVRAADEINDMIGKVIPCKMSDDHANQIKYLCCSECCPHTYVQACLEYGLC